MAFTPSTLSVILQTIGGVGMRFVSYRSDDAIATLTGADYFARGTDYGLRLHDLIFVSPVSGSVEPYVLVVTAVDSEGNVTAEQTAFDAELTALAGLDKSDGNFIVGNGTTWVAENGDTARTSLGLGSAAVADLLDEDDMESDSATAVPSQQSVKAAINTTRIATVAAGASLNLSGWDQVIVNRYDSGSHLRPTLYKQAMSEPSHPGKWQDSVGNWFEIAERVIHAESVGAKIDGSTDDTAAYQRLFAICTALEHDPDLGSGRAVISGQLDFPLNSTIRGGDITLDFTGATLSIGVLVEGADWVDLPALSASPVKGARTLTFATAPTLSKGDIIGLRNPTDGSFNAVDVVNRAYYRAGEYCMVKAVSGTTVQLWEPLIAAYDHTVITTHKFSDDTIKFAVGNLTILGGDDVDNPICFSRLRDARHDNLTVIGGGLYGIYRTQCYNIRGDNVHARQDILSGQGVDYGLVDGSCHKAFATGSFFGKRHGYASGNGGGKTLPCRFMDIRGIFANDQTSSLGSCNAHGNCEFYRFEGEFHGGGVMFGGDHGRARGDVFVADGNEVAISGTECLGTSFDASGMRIFAENSPSTNGLIRFLSTAVGAHTVRGGRINLSNVEVTAPASARLVGITSGGSRTGTNTIVDLRGLVAHSFATGGVENILVNNSTGDGITRLMVEGMRGAVTWSLHAAVKVRGWRRAGSITGDTSTSVSSVALSTVTFDSPAPRSVSASVILTTSSAGGKRAVTSVQNASTTGFIPRVASCDGANFASAETVTALWTAAVDE